jgi:hypothetical protein
MYGQALDAPLLESVSSNVSGTKIARVVGEHETQYGVVRSNIEPKRLIFADKEFVRKPIEHAYSVIDDLARLASDLLHCSSDAHARSASTDV